MRGGDAHRRHGGVSVRRRAAAVCRATVFLMAFALFAGQAHTWLNGAEPHHSLQPGQSVSDTCLLEKTPAVGPIAIIVRPRLVTAALEPASGECFTRSFLRDRPFARAPPLA
jgi:hypothetical protein